MNKTLTRTICIKLDVNGHDALLQQTQQRFNAAASWIATYLTAHSLLPYSTTPGEEITKKNSTPARQTSRVDTGKYYIPRLYLSSMMKALDYLLCLMFARWLIGAGFERWGQFTFY